MTMLCYDNFRDWCKNTIPATYDDSFSYYEVVCKLITFLKQQATDLEGLAVKVAQNGENIEEINERITVINQQVAVLEAKMKEYEEGSYSEIYIEAVYNWIKDNIDTVVELVSEVVHFVQFSLTANGYFAITIPTNWDFLTFDTIMTPECPCWGHLTLSY